jgi:hypothetical protein
MPGLDALREKLQKIARTTQKPAVFDLKSMMTTFWTAAAIFAAGMLVQSQFQFSAQDEV